MYQKNTCITGMKGNPGFAVWSVNGHLANEHVQLAVQLRTSARGVTLII
jgi:hypothetical protein